MKTLTINIYSFKELNEDAKQKSIKMAYSFIMSYDNLLMGKSFKYDGRTSVGKLAARLLENIEYDVNLILEKKKKRRESHKTTFFNYKSNPIVIDYLNNKNDIVFITENQIRFSGGRNHHAKNEIDEKIICVLKKHFTN